MVRGTGLEPSPHTGISGKLIQNGTVGSSFEPAFPSANPHLLDATARAVLLAAPFPIGGTMLKNHGGAL
jgi:hypothetical protein